MADGCVQTCSRAADDTFAVSVELLGPAHLWVGGNLTVIVTPAELGVQEAEPSTPAAASITTAVSGNASHQIRVPIGSNFKTDGVYMLQITANSNDISSTTMTDTTDITIETAKQLGYITTDKPIYKPGHTVKDRVFAVSTDLHAVRTAVTVEATDAAGNTIKRWQLQTSTGKAA